MIINNISCKKDFTAQGRKYLDEQRWFVRCEDGGV